MPDNVLPNNPYARPINATRPEGQMLQNEYYGKRSTDKQLAGIHGRQVSPANRYYGRSAVTPVDMDAPANGQPLAKPKRPRGLKADKVVVDEPVAAITEDDLFG